MKYQSTLEESLYKIITDLIEKDGLTWQQVEIVINPTYHYIIEDYFKETLPL